MKKLINVLIHSLLLVSTAALVNVEKTIDKVPDPTNTTTQVLDIQLQSKYQDFSYGTHRKQLSSDVRTREQRNQAAGKDASGVNDINSEVSSNFSALFYGRE